MNSRNYEQKKKPAFKFKQDRPDLLLCFHTKREDSAKVPKTTNQKHQESNRRELWIIKSHKFISADHPENPQKRGQNSRKEQKAVEDERRNMKNPQQKISNEIPRKSDS